jgi:hypothetical protein
MIKDQKKLRSWQEINRILEVSSHTGSVTADQASVLFSRMRMYLELINDNNYQSIKFMANLGLHDKLYYKNSLYPLRYLAKLMDEAPPQMPLEDLGRNALQWSAILEEIDRFLIDKEFPINLITNDLLRAEFSASAFSLFWGKEITCVDSGIYNEDKTIN